MGHGVAVVSGNCSKEETHWMALTTRMDVVALGTSLPLLAVDEKRKEKEINLPSGIKRKGGERKRPAGMPFTYIYIYIIYYTPVFLFFSFLFLSFLVES